MRVTPVTNGNYHANNNQQSFGMAIKITEQAKYELGKTMDLMISDSKKLMFTKTLKELIESQKNNPVEILLDAVPSNILGRILAHDYGLFALVGGKKYTSARYNGTDDLGFLKFAVRKADLLKSLDETI